MTWSEWVLVVIAAYVVLANVLVGIERTRRTDFTMLVWGIVLLPVIAGSALGRALRKRLDREGWLILMALCGVIGFAILILLWSYSRAWGWIPTAVLWILGGLCVWQTRKAEQGEAKRGQHD